MTPLHPRAALNSKGEKDGVGQLQLQEEASATALSQAARGGVSGVTGPSCIPAVLVVTEPLCA